MHNCNRSPPWNGRGRLAGSMNNTEKFLSLVELQQAKNVSLYLSFLKPETGLSHSIYPGGWRKNRPNLLALDTLSGLYCFKLFKMLGIACWRAVGSTHLPSTCKRQNLRLWRFWKHSNPSFEKAREVFSAFDSTLLDYSCKSSAWTKMILPPTWKPRAILSGIQLKRASPRRAVTAYVHS